MTAVESQESTATGKAYGSSLLLNVQVSNEVTGAPNSQPPADVHSHLGAADALAGQRAASMRTAASSIATQIIQMRLIMR